MISLYVSWLNGAEEKGEIETSHCIHLWQQLGIILSHLMAYQEVSILQFQLKLNGSNVFKSLTSKRCMTFSSLEQAMFRTQFGAL